MGKIVSNFFISLDGVVERPDQWQFPYFNEEMGAIIGSGMETCAAFLMGRALYDEWAEYWPESTDEFASFINNIPKYVVSDQLDEAGWNNTTLVSGDVEARLREIKERTDGDIVISGSATLVRWLLARGLVDELALLVHPIAVGHGQRLFEDDRTHYWDLKHCKQLETGVLHLVYTPAAKPPSAD